MQTHTGLFYVVRLETETGEFTWAVTTSLRNEVNRFRAKAGIDYGRPVKAEVEGVFMQESTALDVMERLSATDYMQTRRAG